MKGYTNFADGFLGMSAIATKPIGAMKYMDWNKVQQIVNENPNSVIHAGLIEDWNNTSGLIFAKGKYYDGYVYGCSKWATPIVDVDGEEIECWTYEQTKEVESKPTWWGNGQKLLSEWDYEDDCDDEEDEDMGCKFCEDMDEMYETVCYIPHDNGRATDIPVNFCPNCGRKLT